MRSFLLVLLALLSSTSLARQQPKSLASVVRTTTTATTTPTTAFVPIIDTDTARTHVEIRGGAKSKLSSFATRTASAAVVLPGLILLIKKTGKDGIVGLVLASQIGMFSEAMNVSAVTTPTKWWALLTNMLYWNTKYLGLAQDKTAMINLGVFAMLVLHICVLVLQQNQSAEFSQSLRSFCASHAGAALLVGMSSSWLATLQEYGMCWIYYPFLLVIINDTMAYICGQLLGKNSLLPNISPNKTREGFVGAAIFTVALSKPLWSWLVSGSEMQNTQIYLLATYISLVAPFGGFLASSVKRTFGKKDFGAIMPGHGGLVDRLDCQLLTAPFIYLYLKYLGGL